MITQHDFGTASWMDVFDPTTEELESLDDRYGLGDRTFDEARRRAARPTMQRFSDHAYVVAFSGTLAEIDMYVGDGWFITVRRHDEHGREWDPAVAFDRIQRLAPDVTPGMMLATVVEELVDGYFDSTDAMEDKLESIEDRIFGEPLQAERQVQQDLFGVRRELLEL
ncbi:MAG: CorA family divalent cation transporter, partial [Ilumatobacteraceae bacterium]